MSLIFFPARPHRRSPLFSRALQTTFAIMHAHMTRRRKFFIFIQLGGFLLLVFAPVYGIILLFAALLAVFLV